VIFAYKLLRHELESTTPAKQPPHAVSTTPH
jgi:hypothetical protein